MVPDPDQQALELALDRLESLVFKDAAGDSSRYPCDEHAAVGIFRESDSPRS